MIEFDPSKNLELSQETLSSAWHDVAEALVLHSDTVESLKYELPPSDGGNYPYKFSMKLSNSFAKETLLEDDDIAQSAQATYIMEHRLDDDPAYPETYEAVVISWSHLLGQSNVKAERSLTLNLIRGAQSERYDAEMFVEYAEFINGEWRRVSPGAHDYSDVPTLDVTSQELRHKINQGIEDFDASVSTVTLSDVEHAHKVAEYIRSNH